MSTKVEVVPVPRTQPLSVLTLLGGFRLDVAGETISLPMSAQRLVAFVAIKDRPAERTHVAGSLWQDASEVHAAGCLRSALWRARAVGDLIDTSKRDLRLGREVSVDLHEGIRTARSLVSTIEDEIVDLNDVDTTLLSDDLLPEWSDDWVTIERERFRQLRLHALEALCEREIRHGHHARAVHAGIAAVMAEPLRETAHCALIKAFVAEGNIARAIGQYQQYRQLLRQELDLEPSDAIASLIPLHRTADSR